MGAHGPIKNGADTTLDLMTAGSVPSTGEALTDWMQPMTFGLVTKTVVGFQAAEAVQTISFQGFTTPGVPRRLNLKPEGQRAWTWFVLYADPSLKLDVDDVVTWRGVPTRVMSRSDYSPNGYVMYDLVQDWQ